MTTHSHRPAIWALLLTIPVPTIGVWLGMYLWPDRLAGEFAFSLAKLWVLAFPIAWLLYHHGRFSWSPVNGKGLLMGCISGMGMALIILASFLIFGMSNREFKSQVQRSPTQPDVALQTLL